MIKLALISRRIFPGFPSVHPSIHPPCTFSHQVLSWLLGSAVSEFVAGFLAWLYGVCWLGELQSHFQRSHSLSLGLELAQRGICIRFGRHNLPKRVKSMVGCADKQRARWQWAQPVLILFTLCADSLPNCWHCWLTAAQGPLSDVCAAPQGFPKLLVGLFLHFGS